MAMNFVTFNQDYSYLAVGELSPVVTRIRAYLLTPASHRQGIPHIHNRSLCEEL